MKASAAVKECESSLFFSSRQGSLPQDAPSISTIMDNRHDMYEQDDDELVAFIPDPTKIIEPCPGPQNASTGPPQSGSGRAWGSDKCVLVKCYRPGSGKISEYQVVMSQEPVLITRLRWVEQNVAYETLLAKAPASEIQEQYKLHLTRLGRLREAIAAREAAIERFRGYQLEVEHELHGKGARDDAKLKAELQKLEKRTLLCKRAVKENDKLRACERAVVRLLVKCEDAGKGEPGFKKVNWQTGQ